MRNDNRGVSKIIGVVILVVIVIMLSVGVLFTAQTLIGDQPKEMTAGTTDERVDFYTHEAQLVNQGNTDNVYAISPLGTEYKLENAGDLQKILPLKRGSHPGVDQYQIVGERDGQRQLLKTNHFEEGVSPDVVVHDDGDKDYDTIQEAINNIDDDTERDISSENPGVIVVQKGVYKENIEVTDDITLIAEYGTVIEDANPNEDVVDIRGDNVRFQNFEVDGNPNPDDTKHYSRHGINVQGGDAVIQGNTIYRADSPDVTSAAVRVNGENSVVRYNNMRESQQSINFGPDSASPAVCGNQFEDGIGGAVTSKTQQDVATINHWNEGMPTNLAKAVIAEQQKEDTEDAETGYTLPENAPRDVLENTNSRVDPSILGDAAGQAALPFTGTKMGSSSSPGECEISVGLINTDNKSINIEEIEVTINGKTTTIEVVQEVNLGEGESSDTRDGPVATCDCGGDGNYDPGDRISVSESSFGEIQTYTTEGTFEPLPFTEGEGSEPTPSSFNVQSSGGTSITTTSTPDPPETTTDNDKNEDTSGDNEETTEPDFRILLGSSVDINLADEVVLEPVISGAESDPEDIEYEWSLGDGTTSTDRVVRHVYDEAGTYTVELTVTDPATGETDTDSTKVTVQEGTKDVEKIRSDEQDRLADLVEEDPDGEGKVLYLEEDVTYDTLSTISAQELTIIGQGDNVVLNGPITVTSSGVTFKNVAIEGGLVVQNDDFKLYDSEVSNSNGYAVELNSNGDRFEIGNSKLDGQDGVYVNVDNNVLLSGNTITATDQYGVYTEESIGNVRVRDNTITSDNIGIYESLAVDAEYERNTINAQTDIEEQVAQSPKVNDISVDFTTTDVPLALSTQVSDPDGYPIDEVTWEVNGETFTRHPSNDLIYTFEEPGEYTISVTVTDQFGKTTTESKTVQVEEFEATLTTPSEASLNDDVTANVDYNIPENRIHSIEYEWGDGTSDVVGDSSHTHAYTEMGDYDITVTVNPDEGESRTVTDSVSIVDSPIADFAIEDKLLAGEGIKFNGEYSTAPDGRTLSYEWDMGDGTTYTKESPQHMYDDLGTYTVTLTVTDSEGYTDSVSAQVELTGFTAELSGQSVVGVGKEAEFDMTTSIGDSNVDKYIIDADGDGQGDASYNSAPFTYTFDSTGEREVTVSAVSDGYGVSKTMNVDVRETPDFDITADKTTIKEGETISFSAENVDVSNPTYDWEFGDGNRASEKDVSNTFSEFGSYTVLLTVTDSNGISETKSVEVTVESTETVIYEDSFEQDPNSRYTGSGTGGYDFVTESAPPSGDTSLSVWNNQGGGTSYTVTSSSTYDFSKPHTFVTYVKSDNYRSNTDYEGTTIRWAGGDLQLLLFGQSSSGNLQAFSIRGGAVQEQTKSSYINWDSNTWYKVKGKVYPTQKAYVKVWEAGTSEPTNYQAISEISDVSSGNVRYHANGHNGVKLDLDVADVKFTETDLPSSDYQLTNTDSCTTINTDTTLSSGEHTYDCLIVEDTSTLTLQSDLQKDRNGQFGGVTLDVQDYIYVESGSAISADRQGYGSYSGSSSWANDEYYLGPGFGHDRHRCGGGLPDGSGGGGSYGGNGGNGYAYIDSSDNPDNVYYSGSPYGDASAPTRLGSAGGNGCHTTSEFPPGGGAIKIQATDVVVDGGLTANGGSGTTSNYHGSGGGSGGSIYISADIYGIGEISATGGDGGHKGGGGSGGRISITGQDKTENVFRVDISGGNGYNNGEDGTER